MKKFLLYGHGGAYNHGAEAIVKCTVSLIKQSYPDRTIILSTHFKEQDIEFGLPVDEYCERYMRYAELNKKENGKYDALLYKPTLDKIDKDTVCLSVGGDNYCYDNWRRWKVIHETALERGAVSILWSCSVEPSMLSEEMVATLKSHHLITAREALTFHALQEKGLRNVVPCADIAFLLQPEKCALPDGFQAGNTVAINISPLVVRREAVEGIVLANVRNLIREILMHMDMHIVLLPHVLMPTDNDLALLQEVYRQTKHTGRVSIISEKLSATEYKYIISKCRFGVFARTHASIAAYDSCVPSLVIGYSVKSGGIAQDLDVTDYVLPVQSMHTEDNLLLAFNKMIANEAVIKKTLEDRIDAYRSKALVPIEANDRDSEGSK